MKNSTFTNSDSRPGASVAGYGYGGAIYTDGANEDDNDNVGGTISIANSTFTGNTAAGQGGGVYSFVYPPDVVGLTAPPSRTTRSWSIPGATHWAAACARATVRSP